MNYNGISVSAIFTFDESGNVLAIRSDDYARSAKGGGMEASKLYGTCKNHQIVQAIPTSNSPKPIELAKFVAPVESEACFVEKDGEEWAYVRVKLISIRAEY